MMNRFRCRSLYATVFALTAVSAPILAQRAFADDWPTMGGDERRAGVSAEKIAPPLSLLWRYTGEPVGSTASEGSPPTVVGDTVYFTGKDKGESGAGGVLFALDAKTGARKWIYPYEYGLKDKAVFQTAPVVNGGKIYIGASDGYLYILDAATGHELTKIRTGGAIASTPIISEGILYLASNDHTVYAIDTSTYSPSENWRLSYKTKENIDSGLLLADGYLFFTTADQTVHGVVVSTGRPKWQLRLPFKYLPNAPVYADNTLYVPSGPRLFAIQPTSGNFRWTIDLPGEILAPPAAADGVVYVSCRDAESQEFLMYAIHSGNRRAAWPAPAVLPSAPSAAPTIVAGVLYVPTKRGVIVAVSCDDGKILWQYRSQPSANHPETASNNGRGGGGAGVPGGPGGFGGPGGAGGAGNSTNRTTTSTETEDTSSIAVANGTLYSVTDDGTLSAFRHDAPDTTAPLLTSRYPISAQTIYGGPGMVITGTVLDPGSGLDTDSIKMAIDGIEVTTGYNSSLNLAYYQRKGTSKLVDDSALSPGRHTVTLTAKDYKGNTLNETWSFIVDNNLKPPIVNYDTPHKPTTRPGGITAPPRGGRSGVGM